MQEITTRKRVKGINNMEWVDRRRMEKKNKTLGAERFAKIVNLYINKNIIIVIIIIIIRERVQYRPNVFENRILRRISEPKRDEKGE